MKFLCLSAASKLITGYCCWPFTSQTLKKTHLLSDLFTFTWKEKLTLLKRTRAAEDGWKCLVPHKHYRMADGGQLGDWLAEAAAQASWQRSTESREGHSEKDSNKTWFSSPFSCQLNPVDCFIYGDDTVIHHYFKASVNHTDGGNLVRRDL